MRHINRKFWSENTISIKARFHTLRQKVHVFGYSSHCASTWWFTVHQNRVTTERLRIYLESVIFQNLRSSFFPKWNKLLEKEKRPFVHLANYDKRTFLFSWFVVQSEDNCFLGFDDRSLLEPLVQKANLDEHEVFESLF